MNGPYFTFDIPGDPVAFARARSNGSLRFTPPKQRSAMHTIRDAAIRAKGDLQIWFNHIPLAMTVMASWKYPSSWPKSKCIPQYRTGRPDADNIGKLIADALNGIIYVDDAQLAVVTVSKFYGASSFVRVRIEPLEYREAEPDRRTDDGAGVRSAGGGIAPSSAQIIL